MKPNLLRPALALLALLTTACAAPRPPGEDPVFVLLGEVHDNAEQHRQRAEKLAALLNDGIPTAVVFEQLVYGRDDAMARQRSAAPADVEALIDAGGLDRKGWNWPLHRPLFVAAMAPNATITGAQLPREQVRQLMRMDEAAWSSPLLQLMRRTEWSEARRDAQARQIQAAHCGMLPVAMVAPMALAQRARDTAMAQAMLAARQAGARRVVLIAGNGHVDRELGVPRYLEAGGVPAAQIRAIGYVEQGRAAGARFDAQVQTPAVERDDPCKAFAAPKAAG